MDTITAQAVRAVGGYAAVGRELNLTRAAVFLWARVPAKHVIAMERLSGIPRHVLRPDIFPDPALEETAP